MTELTRSNLERQYADFAEQARRRRQESIDSRALLWLALLPEWTLDLAAACNFPEPDLTTMLTEAERAGLCVVRRDLGPDDREEVRFWMPREVQGWLFEEEWQFPGGTKLRQEIAEIASRIRGAPEQGAVKVSPGVRRWAELALSELGSDLVLGEGLAERVDQALARGKTGVAREWIFAGEALALPLGAEMKGAAARAVRRLNLHFRRIQDQRYVAEFVRREEQIAEVRRLLDPKRKTWAVHFIGHSGVGKTMLMRYLTGRLPDADPFIFAARVDFDLIDPRFPLEAPARLLQELGEGLAADLQDVDQEASYRDFRESVTRLEAAERDPQDADPLSSPEFAEVVAAFAAFLRSLPQPVVLILDTCEELAKLYPAGADLPSIRAMFKMLEQVHAEVSSVRVVFAGRRWLTRQAANRVRGIAMPPAVRKMEPRPYMRMHAVLGFTRKEVVEYLCRTRNLEIGEEMIAAILEHTFDPGVPPSLDQDAIGPIEKPRYNPNDVALFAGWIEREPGLSAEDLTGGNRDPYVEVRIFERIKSQAVLSAIPAAVLLERFDAETIRPAIPGDSMMQARAIDGLIEQEWTHLEGGADPEEIMISIDSGLLRRLQTFYEDDARPERRREIDEARERLEPHLVRMFELPTAEVPPDRIDSAVRALPIEKSLALLERMADRVAQEPAWPWAEAVARFLLSDEREPALPKPLVAPVRAMYTAALKHRRSTIDLGQQWRAVEKAAADHLERERRAALECRGRLGALAAAVRSGSEEPLEAGAVLVEGRRLLHRRGVGREVAPGLLAALESIVDAREERNRPMPVAEVSGCLAALLEEFKGDDAMWCHVLALRGRVHAIVGDWSQAREEFARLEDAGVAEPERQPCFADWVAPSSIRHRALLELLRFRLADASETPELVELCERAALDQLGAADSAQLLSLVLQARLARGDLEVAALAMIERFESFLKGYDMTAPAHRVAPPLFASLAEAWLAAGRPSHALDLLAEREQLATALRTDEDSAGAAALATVRVLRTMRSGERLGLIRSTESAPEVELRTESLAAGTLIAGNRPALGLGSNEDHAAWRARNLLDPRTEAEALELKRKAKPATDGNAADRLHLALDRVEAQLVQRRRVRFSGPGLLTASAAARALASERRDEPSIGEPLGEEALRLTLRRRVILREVDWPALPGRPRAVGRVALEEGELLALRLPHRAIELLDFAQRCFTRAGDAHGAFFADLRGAIAEVHAGRADEARERRRELLRRFERLRSLNPDLPSVEQLLAAKAAAGERVWDGVDLLPGWTSRLVAYLRWCDHGIVEGDLARGLRQEPELTLAPVMGAPGTEMPSGPLRTHPVLLPIALLLTVAAAAAIVGLVTGTRLDRNILVGLGAVSITVGLGTLVLELIARVLPLSLFPVDAFDVSITRARRWPASSGLAKVRLDPSGQPLLVRAYFRMWKGLNSKARWQTLVAPTDDGIQPRKALALALRPRFGGGFSKIRLMVSSDLAQVGWEWRLAGHLSRNESWDPERMPAIWRVPLPGNTTPPPSFKSPRLVAVCSSQWRPFVESVPSDSVYWQTGIERDQARAAFALGFPVRTRAGWRLRLDDSVAAGSEETPRQRTQRLLSPDRLVARAPIAVVVGRPGGSPLADRRMARGLRGFANEAFLAGAYAVISVPPLPPERTAEAIRMLAEEISRWTVAPDSAHLLDLTNRLRRLISQPAAGASEPDPSERERQALVKLAYDTCLFGPR